MVKECLEFHPSSSLMLGELERLGPLDRILTQHHISSPIRNTKTTLPPATPPMAAVVQKLFFLIEDSEPELDKSAVALELLAAVKLEETDVTLELLSVVKLEEVGIVSVVEVVMDGEGLGEVVVVVL